MNDKKYRWVLYIIVSVIIVTIGIQLFWNYKNYLNSKQQLINDVQVSLDNAINSYYENLAKHKTQSYTVNYDTIDKPDHLRKIDSTLKELKNTTGNQLEIEYLEFKESEDFTYLKVTNDDSLGSKKTKRNIKILGTKDIFIKNIEDLTSKIIFSITSDTIYLKHIDTIFDKELARKKITVPYGISYVSPFHDTQYLNKNNITKKALKVSSKSAYLPEKSTVEVFFTNQTFTILKRIYIGVFISIILVLAIISCLLYLLKIIKHQKQLSTVKNDLISNITHEFKTPIATIGVALESIQHFDGIHNKEKTTNYLNISTNQLQKLNTMVEKLLETATLDSDQLQLNIESTDLVLLLKSCANKYQLTSSKKIDFKTTSSLLFKKIDVFHFENAINNILDNAIKYGGDLITVCLSQTDKEITIEVKDNGYTLDKNNASKIFEQFYRIQKGNTHDIKGFGIGLYYSQKIIKKHHGSIILLLENKETSFKITLPYVSSN